MDPFQRLQYRRRIISLSVLISAGESGRILAIDRSVDGIIFSIQLGESCKGLFVVSENGRKRYFGSKKFLPLIGMYFGSSLTLYLFHAMHMYSHTSLG